MMNRRNKILLKLSYLSMILCFLPAKVLAINLGVFQLSVFRMILIVMAVVNLYENGFRIRLYSGYSHRMMYLWLVYAVYEIFWSKDIGNYFRVLYFLLEGIILTQVFTRTVKDEKNYREAFSVMRIPLSILLCLGIMEVVTGKYYFLEESQTFTYRNLNYLGLHTPVVMSGNVNDYVTLVLFAGSVFFICYLTDNRKVLKAIDAFFSLVSVGLIVVSGSRGALLGLLLVVLYTFIFIKKARKYIISLGIIITIVFGRKLLPIIYDNLSTINIRSITSTIGNESESIRGNMIRNGFHFLKKTYFMGVGAGQFEDWMKHNSIYYTSNILNMHNWWAEILVEHGIVIFVMYVVFYYRLSRDMIIGSKSDNIIISNISKGCGMFVFGYIIASVSASSNFTCEWLWVFWAIAIAWQRYICEVRGQTQWIIS